MPSSTFIVTSGLEFDRARALARPGDRFICSTHAGLRSALDAGYGAVLLDSSHLAPRFELINRWALRVLLNLTSRHRGSRRHLEFLECNQYWIRMDLIRTAKFFMTWDRVFAADAGGTVHIADSADLLFRLSLEEWAAARRPGMSVKIFGAVPDPAVALGRPGGCLKRGLSAAANGSDRLVRRLAGRRPAVVISGSQRHLGGLASVLLERGTRLICLDTQVHIKTWMWCLSKGVRYRVMDTTLDTGCPFGAGEVFLKEEERVIGDHRLPGSVDRILSAVWARPAAAPRVDHRRLERWAAGERIEAVVLDEDVATRRPLLLMARSAGVPAFVTSHGVPMYRIGAGTEEAPAHADSAVIYVNSEFEKEIYAGHFLDPARLVVTGVPRYDPLPMYGARVRRGERSDARPRTVLYCASSVIPHDFSRAIPIDDFMSAGNYSLEFNRRYLSDLVRATAAVPGARLVVKPHYADEDVYREWLGEMGASGVRIASHDADLFGLQSECDVMVTAESTVMFEAAFLGKPVILMHYQEAPLQIMSGDETWLRVARSSGDLDRYLSDGLAGRITRASGDLLKRYWAYADGKNTQRVADHMLSLMSGRGQ